MFRTENPEKGKQLSPVKTAVFITVWVLLLGAAMAFIAFAGHV